MTNKPLAGLNVLDMSWFGAGPIAGRALANAGARVIKLETEKRIDQIAKTQILPPRLHIIFFCQKLSTFLEDKGIR